MRNKDGKAGVVILILAIIILIAAVPWYFIIVGNLEAGGINLFGPKEAEEATEDESEPPDDLIEPEDEQDPSSEHDETERGDEHNYPPVDKIADIWSVNMDLFDELTEIASDSNAVAVSLVLYDGKTGEYYTYEYGYADIDEERFINLDTKFRIASLAKLTTMICAMVLVDEGLIDLDTDISVYLGYEVQNTNYPAAIITTRMLMQHTSSIFDSGAFTSSRERNTSETIRYLLDRGGSFRWNEPGTNFEYSNFGYAVLGAICENVSGKTLDTLSRDVLFRPLGIDAAYVPSNLNDTENIAVVYNETHAAVRPVQSQLAIMESGVLGDDLHLAQGNLTISVIDYARILVMLGNDGVLHGARILSPDAVREIHKTDVVGDSFEQGLATRFSEGGFIPDEGFFWHTGSGYGLLAQYLSSAEPGENRGVIVVTTGATSGRERNGMVSLCNDLSRIVWDGWDILRGIVVEEEEIDAEEDDDD